MTDRVQVLNTICTSSPTTMSLKSPRTGNSSSTITPGMVQRIKEMFEETEQQFRKQIEECKEQELQLRGHLSEETIRTMTRRAPLIKSTSSRKDRLVQFKQIKNLSRKSLESEPTEITESEDISSASPRLSSVNFFKRRSSIKNEKCVTVSAAELQALLVHYRSLCKAANENELPLCSTILEAEEPFIGSMYEGELMSAEDSEHSLAMVRSQEGNDRCADCNSHDSSWASTNLGVFLCIRCSGVHRSLGVHISSILSCTLDVWSYENIERIRILGNDRINEIYEYHLPKDGTTLGSMKISPESMMDERQLFIKSKYVQKEFHKSSTPDLNRYHRRRKKIVRSSVKSVSSRNLRSFAPQFGCVEYCGIIFIDLQRLRQLGTIRRNGTSSMLTCYPFVKFEIGSQIVFSKKWKGRNQPRWKQSIKLNLPMDDRQLRISVWDHSILKNTAVQLGSSVIDLSTNNNFSNRVELQLPIGDAKLFLTVCVQTLM